MAHSAPRGITLMALVIGVAIGSVILAGVGIGYAYAKRTAIVNNQRRNVEAIKLYVEQAIAERQQTGVRYTATPSLSWAQLNALRDKLPTWQTDPYTGGSRSAGCTTAGSCYTDYPPITGQNAFGPTLAGIDRAENPWPAGAGSAIIYLYPDTFNHVLNITFIDGSTKTLYGYAIIETDEDGHIVAAAGGDQSLIPLGT